jgi:hypothetical protein
LFGNLSGHVIAETGVYVIKSALMILQLSFCFFSLLFVMPPGQSESLTAASYGTANEPEAPAAARDAANPFGSRPFDRRYASLGLPVRTSSMGLFSLNSRQDFWSDEAGFNVRKSDEPKLAEAIEQEADPNLIVFEGPNDPINPQASI